MFGLLFKKETRVRSIPIFPKFKKLEFSDKKAVDFFTKKFIPHSDFNFIGMWTWDTTSDRQISILNGNLVAKTTDYLTNQVFYTYLGNIKTSDTVEKLLNAAEKENLKVELKLISEDSITGLDRTRYHVEEDRDHFDYVLDNLKLVDYVGRELRGHLSSKRYFLENYGNSINSKILDLSDVEIQKKILQLNHTWSENKKLLNKDIASEQSEDVAIRKIFTASSEVSELILVGIFMGEDLIAYTIDEVVRDDYLIRHFMKANVAFRGVYSFLASESAKALLKIGKRYVNLEQDLGLKNLRQSKKSFSPSSYHKKYTVRRAQ